MSNSDQYKPDSLQARYQLLREKCALLLGKEYVLDVKGYEVNVPGYTEKQYVTFTVKQNDIDNLKLFEPKAFDNSLWFQVAHIYWGHGCHTGLYYNGESRLIAVNDTFNSDNTIIKEYHYEE
jgi:hypothetical protein